MAEKKPIMPKLDRKTGLYKYPREKKGKHNIDVARIPTEYFPKIKIIVDSEQSKEQVLKALEHLHSSDIDTDLIAVNSLVHTYLFPDLVQVKPDYDFNPGKQR